MRSSDDSISSACTAGASFSRRYQRRFTRHATTGHDLPLDHAPWVARQPHRLLALAGAALWGVVELVALWRSRLRGRPRV